MDAPTTHDEQLCAFLADSDMPCPGCGYNLRGLRAGACPECNQALVLQVALAEPRMGPLIATIVGLAAGAGAAASWTVIIPILVGMGWKSWPPWRW